MKQKNMNELEFVIKTTFKMLLILFYFVLIGMILFLAR